MRHVFRRSKIYVYGSFFHIVLKVSIFVSERNRAYFSLSLLTINKYTKAIAKNTSIPSVPDAVLKKTSIHFAPLSLLKIGLWNNSVKQEYANVIPITYKGVATLGLPKIKRKHVNPNPSKKRQRNAP